MDSKVFDRIEKKYLITLKDKREILKVIKKNMKNDNYHRSGVLNIYFDNDNFDLIIQSIDWEEFKEKIRARSYKGYDRVFLEIKTKIRGKENNIGYKRRVMVTRDDYQKLIAKKTTMEELVQKYKKSENDIQIAKEIDYLIENFNLKPKILVNYIRESYRDENGLRITFDTNLKFRTKNLKFNQGKSDKIIFNDDHNIIMEIKAHGSLPLWLVKKMSEQKLYPQRFSKIGKTYEIIKKEQHV